jgi:putative spermidine/putrescine transport system permease protein
VEAALTSLSDRIGAVLVRLSYATLIVILLLPVFITLLLSFDARGILGPLPPTQFSLRWYQSFFTSDIYPAALRWSVVVTSLAVLTATITGTLTALYLYNRRFAGREVLLSFFLSPFVIPHVVIGFGLLMAFSYYQVESAFIRLVLGHTLLVLPLSIRMILVSLEGLGRSLSEAALTLGARPFWVFVEILFPLIRPSIFASVVFSASASFGEVTMSVFLADTKVRTFPIALLTEMVSNIDLTIAAASSVLIVGTVAIVMLVDCFIGLDRVTGGGVFSRR